MRLESGSRRGRRQLLDILFCGLLLLHRCGCCIDHNVIDANHFLNASSIAYAERHRCRLFGLRQGCLGRLLPKIRPRQQHHAGAAIRMEYSSRPGRSKLLDDLLRRLLLLYCCATWFDNANSDKHNLGHALAHPEWHGGRLHEVRQGSFRRLLRDVCAEEQHSARLAVCVEHGARGWWRELRDAVLCGLLLLRGGALILGPATIQTPV